MHGENIRAVGDASLRGLTVLKVFFDLQPRGKLLSGDLNTGVDVVRSSTAAARRYNLSRNWSGKLCPSRWSCLPFFPSLPSGLSYCVRLLGLVVLPFSGFSSHLVWVLRSTSSCCLSRLSPIWCGALLSASCLRLVFRLVGQLVSGLGRCVSCLVLSLSPQCFPSGLVCCVRLLGLLSVPYPRFVCLSSLTPACRPPWLENCVRVVFLLSPVLIPGLFFPCLPAYLSWFCLQASLSPCFQSGLYLHSSRCLSLVSGLVFGLVSHAVSALLNSSIGPFFVISPTRSPSLSPIRHGMLCRPSWSCAEACATSCL